MRIVKKLLKIALAILLVGFVCTIPLYVVVFKVLPNKDPDGIFNREAILNVLSGETRVFYRDGNSLLGAFFDVNHRIYVPFGEIPENVVNALVAAEDSRYWEHHGFDIRGFSRAMLNNIRMGHLREGGSSLTQQAVKNIFGREETSIKEKWRELINALRMEKNFSKEEILEFYLNQFHVSGTGKGVAIAAQYFFNKELKDLTLAECAFIAGSVKGPYNYDPFIQRNEERRKKALENGRARLQYVLGRMVEEHYITKSVADSALAKPLIFKRGNFRFTLSTTLSRLEEKLDGEFYSDLFKDKDVNDWRKAQLEVVTTLDAEYQNAAMHAVQENISDLQVRLGGFVLPKSDLPNRALYARKGDYLYGAVDSVTHAANGELQKIYLSFGQLQGFVDAKMIKDFGTRVGANPATVLAPRLGKGSVLLVSILDSVTVNERVPCQIETEPVLQGALVALQEGRVVATQGGFHDTGFDRSFKALRQLGSSWKPLLYGLALKYNWHYLDVLENDFNLFQYNDVFYFPRPDHKNKGETVSMLWAATRSENVASIWLLEHLLDKLSLEEFEQVAKANGYARFADEDDRAYFERLRDKYGLTLRDQTKQEIQFTRARDALVRRFIYEGSPQKARTLQNMFYGRFVEAGIRSQKKNPENLPLLNHNYLHYYEILRERLSKESNLGASMPLSSAEQVMLAPSFTLADFKRLVSMVEPVDNEANYLDMQNLRDWPDFRRSLAMAAFATFANEIGVHGELQKVFSMPLGVNEIPLADMTTAYQTLLTGKIYKCADGDWNEPCMIQEIKDRDGRTLFVNSTESKRVLSDTVTAQIGIMLRSVFVHGTARSQLDNITLNSPDGKTKLKYPALGKTGTTNDYRNVAFMGAIPTYVPSKNGFALDSVIAVGSYIGFDDNRPLKSGRTRIAGASGGLPQWASFAKGVIDARKENKQVDFLDISLLATGEAPFRVECERGMMGVDPLTGIPLAGETEGGLQIPWLDVPGYIPPVVTATAAATAASSGFVTSLSLPAPVAGEATTATTGEATTSSGATAKPATNEWELPPDFSGKEAFVPIGPDF